MVESRTVPLILFGRRFEQQSFLLITVGLSHLYRRFLLRVPDLEVKCSLIRLFCLTNVVYNPV
jgi:hypothetical protein